MAEDRIRRKDLWNRLNNIGQSDWIKAAERLGLDAVKSLSGTSHTYTIRDPKNSGANSSQGLIATIQIHLYKQANQKIFKRFIACGIPEDDIWRSLGLK
jgi:hypothetical protein